MKMLKTVVTSLLLLGFAAAPAFAGDHGRGKGHGHDRGRHSYYDRDHRRDHDRDWRREHRRGDDDGWRRDYGYRDRVVYVQPRRVYVQPRPVYVRHAPPPRWARGGYYYGRGYAPTYVVHDYGHYGLRHPPRGYGWRRSDTGEFLLVALATGIIADIILSR